MVLSVCGLKKLQTIAHCGSLNRQVKVITVIHAPAAAVIMTEDEAELDFLTTKMSLCQRNIPPASSWPGPPTCKLARPIRLNKYVEYACARLF